jgi:hypothetical protein
LVDRDSIIVYCITLYAEPRPQKKGNKLYYYVVESARVDGQPRIVHQAYLGTALNLLPFAGIAFLWFIAVVRNRLESWKIVSSPPSSWEANYCISR